MPHRRLFLQFRNKSLNALIEDKKTGLEYQKFLLQETSKEGLIAKLKTLKFKKASETILIVPREELLSQDFDLTASEGSFKKALYAKLENSFPYRVEELSYGIRVLGEAEDTLKGTVMATTNQKLNEWIRPIEAAGLDLNDIVSSDEALLGFFLKAKGPQTGKALFFDVEDDFLECLFIENGKVRLSKVFSTCSLDLLREIGLLTLEFEGFEKIYISGKTDEVFQMSLQHQFQVPIERLAVPLDSQDRPISRSVYGARVLSEGKFLSLLPVARKLKKKKTEAAKDLLATAVSVLVFCAVAVFFFWAHLKTLEAKFLKFEQKAGALKAETQALKKMHETLLLADGNYAQNERTLLLFKEVAVKLPHTITLNQLTLGQKEIILQGESLDNASVADAMGLLKGLKGIGNLKLEYTRLKDGEEKRNTFEFLITAERTL